MSLVLGSPKELALLWEKAYTDTKAFIEHLKAYVNYDQDLLEKGITLPNGTKLLHIKLSNLDTGEPNSHQHRLILGIENTRNGFSETANYQFGEGAGRLFGPFFTPEGINLNQDIRTYSEQERRRFLLEEYINMLGEAEGIVSTFQEMQMGRGVYISP